MVGGGGRTFAELKWYFATIVVAAAAAVDGGGDNNDDDDDDDDDEQWNQWWAVDKQTALFSSLIRYARLIGKRFKLKCKGQEKVVDLCRIAKRFSEH